MLPNYLGIRLVSLVKHLKNGSKNTQKLMRKYEYMYICMKKIAKNLWTKGESYSDLCSNLAACTSTCTVT